MNECIDKSIEYLKSRNAIRSISNDPYWPKWNSPWWHMLLLHELNETDRIPEEIIELMADKIQEHYLNFFPLTEKELPENIDGYREIMCHCALGSIMQIFYQYGFDYKNRFPWLSQWIVKYQLDDGGYNCEESAYTGSGKSSVMSTLPVIEFLLLDKNLLPENQRKRILEKAYSYLMKRKLVYSSTNPDKIMDPYFKKPSFPRFYKYDILRGMKFITTYLKEFKTEISEVILTDLKIECRDSLKEIIVNEILNTETLTCKNGKWQDEQGEYFWKKTDSFPLLDHFMNKTNIEKFLIREMNYIEE